MSPAQPPAGPQLTDPDLIELNGALRQSLGLVGEGPKNPIVVKAYVAGYFPILLRLQGELDALRQLKAK